MTQDTLEPGPETQDHNHVSIEGRLSADPELKDLESGDRLVILRVVARRPDGTRGDSLPVAVGPPPPKGQRRAPGQAGRREVTRASKLSEGDRVRVEGFLQRRFWAAGGVRRSRLQVVAESIERVDA